MDSQPFQLVMRSGPEPGKVFDLLGEVVTIGREIGNDIVISDPEVSRKHARLQAQEGGYIIEDAGSMNGTFVDGQRLLGPHILRPGELIMFGESVGMVYEASQFDHDATIPSAPSSQPVPPTQPDAPTPVSPTQQEAPPTETQTAYSGQIPEGPIDAYVEPLEPYEFEDEEDFESRTWLWIFSGCAIVLLCVCIASLFIIDTLNFWCYGSLEGIWNSFGFVCQP